MVKNLLSGKSLLAKLFGLGLTFLGVMGFGQINKLDPRFDILLKNKDKASKGIENIHQLNVMPIKLDEHLVVTAEGEKKMYSAIIYTKDAKTLREKGILVQSEFPNFVTALVDIPSLETLVAEPSVLSIQSVNYAFPTNDISRAQSGASLLQDGAINNTKYTGKDVLVGVIDTGIDWAHPDFRDINDPTKSRIYSIWDMSLTKTGTETPPDGFDYGVEYTRAMIEDELDGTPANFVREKDTNGHGTHVAGTAAGNGAGLPSRRHKGFAPEADLVIVKGYVRGGFSNTNIINGLSYFKNVATKLGKPIVVNMSLGGHASAHDGTAAHEIAINEFVKEKGRAVAVAAGNEYGDNLHTSISLAPNETKSMAFKVGSDTTSTANTLSYALVFGTENNQVDANILAPDGKTYNFPTSATTTHQITDSTFTLSGANYLYTPNMKRFFEFALKRNAGKKANSAGTYTINFTNKGDKNITLHGYKFDLNDNVATNWENPDNKYIVGSPGTADGAITVAAYTPRITFESGGNILGSNSALQEDISSFSSEGPRTDGVLKPDITSAGMFIISSKTGGTEGDYYTSSQGTSMASPGVAGAIALLLQQNPNLTATEIKTLLQNSATKDAKTTNTANARWGYGKLNVYNALAKLVGCYNSEYERLIYDDNFLKLSQESSFNSSQKAVAVRFTPNRTGKLGGSTIYFLDNGTSTTYTINLEIRKANTDGSVGDIIATKTIDTSNWGRFTWNYIDLTDLNVQVTSGEDFYISYNALNAGLRLRANTTNVDKRTYVSSDNTTWTNTSNFDAKIRAYVYEDRPQVKHLAEITEATTATIADGKNYFINNCDLIARVEKNDTYTINGEVSAKVWIDSTLPKYVSRRYEVLPTSDPTSATGKVTLYFTQAEFDAYNTDKSVKLPTSPTDEANKANIIIEKYVGSSNNNTGNPASYSSSAVKITPSAENVKWNDTYQYWEVTFETTGFGGFLVGTSSSILAVDDVQSKGFSIYPNPAKDLVNIELVNNAKINVYDMAGKLVRTLDSQKGNNVVNVSDLPKGVYLLNISFDNGKKLTHKLIKE